MGRRDSRVEHWVTPQRRDFCRRSDFWPPADVAVNRLGQRRQFPRAGAGQSRPSFRSWLSWLIASHLHLLTSRCRSVSNCSCSARKACCSGAVWPVPPAPPLWPRPPISWSTGRRPPPSAHNQRRSWRLRPASPAPVSAPRRPEATLAQFGTARGHAEQQLRLLHHQERHGHRRVPVGRDLVGFQSQSSIAPPCSYHLARCRGHHVGGQGHRLHRQGVEEPEASGLFRSSAKFAQPSKR